MHPSDLTDIIEKAHSVVVQASSINHHEKKKGGVLCVARLDGLIEAVVVIGEIHVVSNVRRYFDFSIEKVEVLAASPRHVSSWQNLSHEKYGGAIRTRDCILSFAGFSPFWDEACMLALAYNLRRRLMTHEQVEIVRRISDNPHATRLITATADESSRRRP